MKKYTSSYRNNFTFIIYTQHVGYNSCNLIECLINSGGLTQPDLSIFKIKNLLIFKFMAFTIFLFFFFLQNYIKCSILKCWMEQFYKVGYRYSGKRFALKLLRSPEVVRGRGPAISSCLPPTLRLHLDWSQYKNIIYTICK